MEKYYGVSSFVYCIGNPIVLIDPIGRVIKVIGSEEFIAKYNAAKAFLENRGVANSLSVLDEASDITIVIKESCSSTFDANTNTINWSSSIMSLSDDKTIMRSPTLSLAHEIEHAVEF